MALRVGTIVEWFSLDDSAELCEDGHCVGKITQIVEPDKTHNEDKVEFYVKWWEKCALHAEIDPNGSGPYNIHYMWEIGQLYH